MAWVPLVGGIAALLLTRELVLRIRRKLNDANDEDEVDYRFLSVAAREAEVAIRNKEGGPFGAVIVKDGEIIAQAHNEVLKTKDPTAHAEILAIQKACKNLGKIELSDCVIYCSCEPCPMSFAAMYLARLPRLVYGAQAEAAHDLGFDSSHVADAIRGTSTFQKSNCTVRRIVHPEVAKIVRLPVRLVVLALFSLKVNLTSCSPKALVAYYCASVVWLIRDFVFYHDSYM